MNYRLLLGGCLAALLAPVGAMAQQAADQTAPDNRNETIVVTARLEKTARDEQKIAPNLVTILSAEAIAKFPDINTAEALSRVAGVSLSTDTGEGRFISIRGLDGNLNGTTLGGVVLLNSEPGGTNFSGGGRAVELDTIPIGAVDRIVVTKTGLPDHDAEGIGGTVELTPRTAIGLSHLFIDVTASGGIETYRNTGQWREQVAVGGPIGGAGSPVSFVISQFLHEDRRTFDDIEEDYVDGQSQGVPDKAYADLQLRRYQYHRKRFGYSGELDYVPAPGQRWYLRATLAGYNESVVKNRLEIDFNGTPTANPANTNGYIDGAQPLVQLSDTDQSFKNLVTQVGGDNHLGKVHLEYWAAYSQATFDEPYGYVSYFQNNNNYNVAYDNITSSNYPRYQVLSGTGFLDPTQYGLDKIKAETEQDKDKEWSGSFAASLPLGLASDDEFKLGAKVRLRDKYSNPYIDSIKYKHSTPLTIAQDEAGSQYENFYDAGYSQLPPIGVQAVRDLYNGSGRSPALDPTGYFYDTENVYAAFAQYKARFGDFGLLTGVRYEHTDTTLRGFASVTDAAGDTTENPVAVVHKYDDFFPTLQLRYQPNKQFVVRATYSTGIARPGFLQTIQATQVDEGAGTVVTGNPQLQPTFSHNFDVSAEYYLAEAGIISLGAFDKEMRNYIITFAYNGLYPGYQGAFNVQSFANTPNSHVRGIEGVYVNHFTSLPGLLGGLGVDANFTYESSGAHLRPGENNALPGMFPWTWNAAGFYEKNGVKLRIAGQFESSTLFTVGSSSTTDVYQNERFTLDSSVSYDIDRRVQIYLNAKNLTNAPLRFYENTSNRPIQREFYDLTLEAGVKLKF